MTDIIYKHNSYDMATAITTVGVVLSTAIMVATMMWGMIELGRLQDAKDAREEERRKEQRDKPIT